jgi:hypothetical protein
MKTKSNNKKRAALPVLNNGLKLLAATVVAGSLNLQQATAQYTPLRPWEGTIDLFSRNTYHTAATRINVLVAAVVLHHQRKTRLSLGSSAK